ncbi:MAG: glucose dehydrogenase [Planctomycetota bacterium]|nr:MAG: glucose dehydrogenase [Planctomycetota bacterium]
MSARVAVMFVALSLSVAAQGTREPPAPHEVHDAPPPAKLAALADNFEHDAELRVELVAAEPLLQHPVAFCVDERGRVYVAETHRHHQGVTDIREHMDWLDDDLAAQTVEDRLAYMRRQTGEDFDDYAANEDRVRLLTDTDGDGRFDAARTFAGDFNSHAAGIGAGLLARDGEITYACIPELWRLRDTDGDDVADEREVLSSGYGVRISLLGHDLHGLLMGPDGRIWFSIGDRGLHVETPDGVIALPDQGAVLRCEPDGSDLQLVHVGLRNPQELAFDDFGNLFTVDNNSDGGDQARLVEIVHGADSGWRQPFQWLSDRGPWKLENWWRAEAHDVFFRLPPLAHIASGPSGLVSDPGGAFPGEFAGGFLLADFLGDPSSSRVVGFRVEPEGAVFRMSAEADFVSGVLATDVDVDPQGRVLISDWVEGWNRTNRGRLWRVTHGGEDVLREQTRRAAELARPFAERSDAELLALLSDVDRRLRDRAHLELATRPSSWPALEHLLHEQTARLPRWHALAALGVAARRHEPSLADGFAAHSLDREPEVRALALRLLGELAPPDAASYVLPRLSDEHPRVRLAAALAASRLASGMLADALLARLRTDDAEDPNLRHAYALALSTSAHSDRLAGLAGDTTRGVRLGALLALRHQGSPRVGNFLDDTDPELRAEAARAMWDTGLAVREALVAEALAARLLVSEPPGGFQDAVLRRALAATDWLGDDAAAAMLLDFALRDDVAESFRADALDLVLDWTEASTRDAVLGHWSVREARAPLSAHVVGERLHRTLSLQPSRLLGKWVSLAGEQSLTPDSEALLRAVLRTVKLPGTLRAKAFTSLSRAWVPSAAARDDHSALTSWALGDHAHELRAAALAKLPFLGEEAVLEHLPALLADGTLLERRVAFGLAAGLRDGAGESLLAQQFEAFARGELPVELQLDLFQAFPRQASEGFRELRRAALGGESLMTLDGPLSALLFGGSRESGARLFEQPALSCVRCHAREGEGIGEHYVGPSLEGLGERLSRRQIFESLRDPNARLAPGFQTTHLFLDDDSLVTGRVLSESPTLIVLLDADGERHKVDVARVSERRPALSAMPEGLVESLTPRDLRDLIAYLAGL